MRLTMMVAPDGRWIFPDSEEFRAVLGDPEPDYDASAFAIKNLGFIRFHIVEQSIIEIELHPRNVSLPALLAVQQQLHSSDVRLFRIKHFQTSWQSEILASKEHTLERLSQLCTPAYTPAPSQRFLAEEQDLSRLFENEHSPFRPLVQKWRMSFGHFDPSVITFAARRQLLSGMIIVGVRPGGAGPVFRFIGDGHLWLGRDYPISGIGERVEHQPDKEFGGWVSQFYKLVANSGQPRYDLVQAVLHYADDGTQQVVRYERLLLPWKTPSDEVLVTLSKIREDTAAEAASDEPPKNSVAI